MGSTLSEMQDLSSHVLDIETCLAALDEQLRSQDTAGIEAASAALHKVLADALVAVRHARQIGQEPLPPALRHRLALAQARVSGLQQSVHRASGSLQRTLDVLLPADPSSATGSVGPNGPLTGAQAALRAYKA